MKGKILECVRAALDGRERVDHPGAFPGAGPDRGATARADTAPADDPVEAFAERFRAAGGEVVRLADLAEAARWLTEFARDFEGAATGSEVPEALRPDTAALPPERAPLGVTMAVAAAADTGSLVLDSRGGRLPQLLPPTHLVWVPMDRVVATLAEALETAAGDLPSALGLHSGPSKSADIGRVIVTGVHGPGRVIAAIVG